MRILLTADPEIPVPPRHYGGIQRIVALLATHLTRAGHSVGLVAHRDSTVPVTYRAAWKTNHSQGLHALLRNTPVLYRACREFQPDLLHSFSRLAFALPRILQKKPLLMSYQREPGSRQVALASALGGRSVHFTGCSEFITNIGARAAQNWRAIPNFLDDAQYTPRLESDCTAPLVFLSRLDRIKGAHTAIAVAKETGVPLVLAGNIADPSYFARDIEPHIDGKQISYIGSVDDDGKQELLASARALLLPIEWDEPFGIVFIEALACGTPIISSPRGAAIEIVVPGICGYLCAGLEEFSTAVHQAGSLDRRQCHEHFLSRYSASVVCKLYEEAYTECVVE